MMHWFHDLSDTLKQWLDAVAIGVVAASVIKALPAIAAALSIVWTIIRISESRRWAQLVRWWQGRQITKKTDILG